jgi:hypothetical protein
MEGDQSGEVGRNRLDGRLYDFFMMLTIIGCFVIIGVYVVYYFKGYCGFFECDRLVPYRHVPVVLYFFASFAKLSTKLWRKPPPGAWLVLPETVEARSEADRAIPCIYRIGAADAIKMARALRRQPIFELWSCVLGNPPPVPGCRHRNRNVAGKLTRLKEVHALFKGIKRPLAEDDDGANVLAYVLKPKYMYAYDRDMESVALKIPVPQDVLFVVYVRLNNPDDNSRAMIGTITHWGFVEADPNDPTLPEEYSSRYRTRLW